MEIRPSVPLLPTQTSAKGISNLIAQLRPGQNLVAVVETRLAENTFLLKLADSGRSISARTQLDLAPGQMLKLEVVSLGPTPELKIVPRAETEPSEAEAMQQALRQFMPKQQGLAELASTLRQALTQQAVKNASDLPEPLRALIRTVLDGLPQKKALLNAEGLRQAARNSGIFFEAHLAAHPSSLQSVSARDLKCRLMALSDALQGILATDADSEQAAASPSDDGRVTVGTPPDGSKAQLDSAKTSTRTATTLQQGSTGDGEPASSLPAGARAETAEMSAKLSAGGEKPAESAAPPKLGMAQTGSQLQESPPPVKGSIGQPVESSGAELPESTTLGPAKMAPDDKSSAIQGQGKADAGLPMAGKPATENGTTIATGSGADKSASAADGRAPQA
ncbi:MAG: putative flagellar hook-length control protein, partial [Proteobacteria bacterium]|nr:putative flagellar hook-length control protein [Pseudomonadota bacterium]